jgi:hypothetical protein
MATTIGSRPDGAGTDHKLTALVTSATRDLSTLVRDEIALAKAELRRDMKQAATGGGLFAVAGVLAVFALIMLSFAAAYGIHAAGLGLAWSWLIVGGAYLFLGALCGGMGMLWLKRIRGVDATKRTANESIAVLKRTVQ